MRIGIDVGGTKISGVLWNDKVVKKVRVPVGKNKKETIAKIKTIIEDFSTKTIHNIGIGVPGMTDGNKIIDAPNLKGMNGVDLSKELKIPIKLLNDADAFALAEARAGAAKGKKNVVGLIVGTGIGSGIIINGEVYRGSNFLAGEVGHIWTSPFSGRDYESQWSGPNLERMYEELSGKKASLKEIAKMKNPEAKAVLAYAAEGIAYVCSALTNILNPEIIVLGGGVSNLDIYPQINKSLKKFSHVKAPKVVKNKLGDDAGVIGAAFA